MAPPSEAEVKFSNLIMTRIGPQVVIVNYPWLCPIFDAPVAEKLRKVCVSVDVGWRRAELLASHIRSGEPELNADQEAAWFRKADAIVAISAADALEFEQMASGRPVFVSPKACRPIMLDAGQSGQKGCCLFVGSSNSFNVEGLTWFLGSVWPTILAARPDATLLVAGTIEKVLTARPRGVKFLGQVSDLAPLYQGSQVVIVPLLRGTGMIIKLVEAAAHGCACVSTPKALEAATWLRGSVIETEDPLEFAAVTLRLLGDDSERTRRGAECRRIVMEELGQHRCYGPLSDWVEAQQV
jgi:succinoglycan biosynthesis protein ExoO